MILTSRVWHIKGHIIVLVVTLLGFRHLQEKVTSPLKATQIVVWSADTEPVKFLKGVPMKLIDELHLRLSHLNEREILLRMGYEEPVVGHFQHLRSVLTDPLLGLASSQLDDQYSAEQFLHKLCEIAGIEPLQARRAITSIQTQITRQENAFKPYLFVDTGFERTSLPVSALAACEGQRYLHFDKDFWSVPLYEQLVMVYERIQQHMDETRGELGIWGYIRRYYFIYDHEGSAIEITPAGQIVAVHDHFSPSTAVVRRKSGHDLKAVRVG